MNELKTFCIWTPFNTIQVIIGFKQSSLTVSHDRMILLIWSHMLCDPHTLLFWSWPLGGTQSPRYCVWKSKPIWSSPGSRTDRWIQSHIHGRVLGWLSFTGLLNYKTTTRIRGHFIFWWPLSHLLFLFLSLLPVPHGLLDSDWQKNSF